MGALTAGAATTNITPDLGCHLVGYFQDRTAVASTTSCMRERSC